MPFRSQGIYISPQIMVKHGIVLVIILIVQFNGLVFRLLIKMKYMLLPITHLQPGFLTVYIKVRMEVILGQIIQVSLAQTMVPD